MSASTRTSRLTLAIAALALFVSLGGDSLAKRTLASLKKNSVTSREIRNGSVRGPDLSTGVRARLREPGPRGPQGPAGTQGPQGPTGPAGATAQLADGSVTTAKLANNAVTGAKVADSTLTAADLAANSVTSSEIAANAAGQSELADDAVGASEMADNAIDSNEVADGLLDALDVAESAGRVSLDFPMITSGQCGRLTFNAATPVDGDAVLVTPGGSFPDAFFVTAAVGAGSQVIVTACNESGADADPGPVDFAYVVFDV